MTRPTADHPKPHPLKGEVVEWRSRAGVPGADEARVTVVDWFDRVTQTDWRETFGDDRNSPATRYAKRRQRNPTGIPKDNNVVMVYTSKGNQMIIHQSEIGVPDG